MTKRPGWTWPNERFAMRYGASVQREMGSWKVRIDGRWLKSRYQTALGAMKAAETTDAGRDMKPVSRVPTHPGKARPTEPTRPWANRTGSVTEAAVKELLGKLSQIGQLGYQGERIPVALVEQMVNMPLDETAEGLGLLTLHVAIANHGLNSSESGEPPRDPAGTSWRGPGPANGKRWVGATRVWRSAGGISIADLDSSHIERAWVASIGWGAGSGTFPWPKKHYGQIRDSRKFQQWCDSAILNKDDTVRPEWSAWLWGYWRDTFWQPNWSAARADLPAKKEDAAVVPALVAVVRKAVYLTRVNNSASGWAKQWRTLPAEKIATNYIEAKRAGRGEDAAERTMRQLKQCDRVVTLFRAYRTALV